MKHEISYVKQSHVISESAYMMPATSRKLIFYAMAHSVMHGKEFKEIRVSTADLVNALGLERGGATYDMLKAITKETKKQVYTIEDQQGYDHISWLETCRYDKENDEFVFQLHKSLEQYVLDLKTHFSFIPLSSVGKLQGKYAIRIFELVLTQAGQEGKSGNKPGTWWYEDSVEMLRHRFDVGKRYAKTHEFRRRVIDEPIEEINSADVGIRITPEYNRKGRKLVSIRFAVRRVSSKGPREVGPVTATAQEITALFNSNPKLRKQVEKELSSQLEMNYDVGGKKVKVRVREFDVYEEMKKRLKKK